jgi:hypothetical protein
MPEQAKKLNTAWLAFMGFLAGIPLSYFFQSPLVRKMPFSRYLALIPGELLGSLIRTSEQQAMNNAIVGNAVAVIIGTCVVCALILGGISYFINKSREVSG